MYKKNLRYPILFSIIWLIFLICRGFDIYNTKINEDKKTSYLPFFYGVINVFMCIRGLLYCFAFFSRSDLCSSNNKKLVQNLSLAESKNETKYDKNELSGVIKEDDGPILNNDLEEEKVNS